MRAKDINTNALKTILDELKKRNKKVWFFLASSSHIYPFSKNKISEKKVPRPINKYGLTKLLAEKILLNKKYNKYVTYCIGRIFSYTSVSQDKSFIVPSLFKKKTNQIENLNHCRDFTHIEDICSAIAILCKLKKRGVYNIGSGKKTNLIAVYNKIKGSSFEIPKKTLTMHLANNDKIRKTGWRPKKNISSIIKDFRK